MRGVAAQQSKDGYALHLVLGAPSLVSQLFSLCYRVLTPIPNVRAELYKRVRYAACSWHEHSTESSGHSSSLLACICVNSLNVSSEKRGDPNLSNAFQNRLTGL